MAHQNSPSIGYGPYVTCWNPVWCNRSRKFAHLFTIQVVSNLLYKLTKALQRFYLLVFLFTHKTVSLGTIHTQHDRVLECEPAATGFTLTSHRVPRKTWDQVDGQKNTGADIAAAFSQSPDVCTVTLTAANQPESNLCVWWQNLKWQHDCCGGGGRLYAMERIHSLTICSRTMRCCWIFNRRPWIKVNYHPFE